MIKAEIILGNSNSRFSGVTSTMLATLPKVQKRVPVTILGKHHLPENTPHLSYREFIKLCRDDKTRVFHARRNNEIIQALAAKKLFGAKLKIIFTSTAQRHHSNFTKWLMQQMDGILTTCTAAESYLDQKADKMIPHGVDLQRFSPPSNKEQSWKALNLPGKYGIGIFGRVRPQKGIDLLIEAAIPLLKKNPNPTIVIVGETTPKFADYQKTLEQNIADADLSDRIIFYGSRPSEELPKLFQAMTLVTALSRNEGFGLTVLEAMASSCAVLTSEAGAWKDIVTHGEHGFTVPCDSLESTREHLAHLLEDEEKLNTMGAAGRQHVEKHYSIEKEAEALCQYYLQLKNT